MCPKLHSVTGTQPEDKRASHLTNADTENASYIDETFDASKSESYHLSIELGTRTIACCVLDTLSNKYVALYHAKHSDHSISGAADRLLDLVQTHEILNPRYKSASIAIVNEQFTTVPVPLYDKTKLASFLHFNNEDTVVNSATAEVLADKLTGVEAYNIYTVPKETIAKLRTAFPRLSMVHHTSLLIDSLLNLSKNKNQKTCFLHVQDHLFSMVVIDGNDLNFCNNFTFNSPEDLAYYTLFVFEQLKLNPESVNTVILGEFDKSSPEYAILYKYIRSMKFIDRNVAFKYSYAMNPIPEHYHFNLFSQYNCVS
ncbi:MAG: DUF3822 family protein [Flavobacteriales bacterium]|nr:DUF3822 family protein [Flavobacteriales bacterium]